MRSSLTPVLRFLSFPMRWKPVVRNHGLITQGKAYNRQRFLGPRPLFCYAPFRSIFISYSGRVSPCYACKAEASVKDHSLEAIWNGDVFSELRRQFKKGILPDACSFCRGHLKNENYASMLALKYDHHAAPNRRMPAIVEFELGNQCALECVMCSGELSSSIRKNREKKPPVDSIADPDFHHQFDFCLPSLRSAEFTGGDPFLIPVYEKLWERIEAVNPAVDILITTNANTMNEKVEALLRRNLKLSFNVSIDSLQKEVYEQIRVNAVFERVMENIAVFAAYARQHQTSIGFLVCPIRQNCRELQDFIPFADKHGATLSYHVVFKPASLALWTMSSEELRDLHANLEKFVFSGHDFTSSFNAGNYKGLVELIRVWSDKANTRERALHIKNLEINSLISSSKKKFWHDLAGQMADADLKHQARRVEALIGRMPVDSFPELVYIRLSEIPSTEIRLGLDSMKDDELTDRLTRYHNEVYYRLFAGEGLSDNDKYELSMKGLAW